MPRQTIESAKEQGCIEGINRCLQIAITNDTLSLVRMRISNYLSERLENDELRETRKKKVKE